MKSYAQALWLALALALVPGCEAQHDYSVVVTWTINGFVADRQFCEYMGITAARLEISDGRGKPLKTLEEDCSATIEVDTDEGWVPTNGFETTTAFDWDTRYAYKVTLLDANKNAVGARTDPSGAPISNALEGELFLDSRDRYYVAVLDHFDYVQPNGQAASVSASWDPAFCQPSDSVHIVLVSGQNFEFELPYELARVDCTAGSWASTGRVLEVGDYRFRYELRRAGSENVALFPKREPSGDYLGIHVPVEDATGTVTLPRASFEL